MAEEPIPLREFSEPAAVNRALQAAIRGREGVLDSIPSIPVILQTLIAELAQPPESVNIVEVADLIGRDKSLTAQCLRMANSPLFGRGQRTDSIRGALRTLGLGHTRDIAVSCTIMQIGASQKVLDPVVFWEHSLGCAIISRKLARSVGFDDPEKAYLGGLLHDIGYIVNLVLSPQVTKAALEKASSDGTFAGEAEYRELGFTHCQSGELVARKWHFPDDIVEVILSHHNPAAAVLNPALVTIVALADRLCRSSRLGLGYSETQNPAEVWQSDWKILAEHCPLAGQMTWDDFVKDTDAYFEEIRELVKTMFR
ncbi:MAG TPA: HDOD domain-containing protein [Verrucomicrobiae bacterium]|nr:HDOD domain-containing protein [Verrucomicrobiae bacterium]